MLVGEPFMQAAPAEDVAARRRGRRTAWREAKRAGARTDRCCRPFLRLCTLRKSCGHPIRIFDGSGVPAGSMQPSEVGGSTEGETKQHDHAERCVARALWPHPRVVQVAQRREPVSQRVEAASQKEGGEVELPKRRNEVRQAWRDRLVQTLDPVIGIFAASRGYE